MAMAILQAIIKQLKAMEKRGLESADSENVKPKARKTAQLKSEQTADGRGRTTAPYYRRRRNDRPGN